MSWRNESAGIHAEYLRGLEAVARARIQKGKVKYGGDTFKGNPAVHLAEELFDAMYYSYYDGRLHKEIAAVLKRVLEAMPHEKDEWLAFWNGAANEWLERDIRDLLKDLDGETPKSL